MSIFCGYGYLVYSQEGVYGRVGVLAVMSLIHGGASFSIFSHTIFNFLCGKHAAKLYPKIEDVADTTCKDLLCKVSIAIHVYVYKNVIKCIYLFFY